MDRLSGVGRFCCQDFRRGARPREGNVMPRVTQDVFSKIPLKDKDLKDDLILEFTAPSKFRRWVRESQNAKL